jgi:hypothetical protein
MRAHLAAATILSFFGFGADSVNFDGVKPGTPPPNWSFIARPANNVRWEVRHDPAAPSRGNVLEKVTPGTMDGDNPVAVFDKDPCRDGDLSVKFRIDGGGRTPTRTAGIVWRYQNPNNYYLLHFSADQKNIVLFSVVNGRYRPVPIVGGQPGTVGVAHDIRVGQWYVVKVMFRGSQVRVLFGNRRLFEADDKQLDLSGRTGVWTRGRTSASFDDFRVDKKG